MVDPSESFLDDVGALDDPEPIEMVLPDTVEASRLDRVVSELLPDVSRTTIQRWMDEGRVWLDGELATRRTRAHPGALVRLLPLAAPPSDALPEDLPLSILYEDEHLLIVDKAAGMVVHPAPGHPGGTLVNAVLFHCSREGRGTGPRPGIVHRLDRDTTGVMVVAKSEPAKDGLVRLFAERDIERRYRAIASGRITQPTSYDTLFGRHPGDRKRFSSRVDRGKRAITHVEPVRALFGATLIDCRLETGRTHQIRVHLADHGHPLIGDPIYGRTPRDPRIRSVSQALGRQALHASLLAFRHPMTGEMMRYETEPPADFQEALRQLEPNEGRSP